MATKHKRVAFYLRVSMGSQTVENQGQEIAKAAEQLGCGVSTVQRVLAAS